ncbi:MAG: hypothetical protein CW336_00730 [Bacteroidetes bacterium]|nr:hypothetical protein [Bacteroidota bacterium]
MKKVFLLLTMLLFAFVGTMRADEVTVCDGTATNEYVPVYGLYADTQGCQSEFVIPASEIGILPGSQISKLTFYLRSPATAAWTATFQVYMTEIEGTTLSAFVGPSGCTQVYQGALNGTGSTMEVVFDNDYTYNGGNLLIGTFVSTAGNWKSAKFYGVTATGASIQRNSSSASTYQRNFLPKTTFEYTPGGASALTTNPTPLELGYRPNGAWMAPYVFNIENAGGVVTVNALDFSGDYFTFDAELPASVSSTRPLPVAVSTGTAEDGVVNSTLTVLYGGNRDAEQFAVTATAYTPVDGDVYEKATVVSTMPYAGNAPAGIKKNYALPTETEGADAVYKMTFANDVMLTAGTTGADGVAALYTEDFAGEGGPMVDNNYVYNGPAVNPGPANMWFNYAYTGSNTWYGTSAGGGMMWGYIITPDMLQDLGLGEASVVTVESAARNSTLATYYDLVIMKGGDTPNIANMVYYQENEDFTPGYYFDINLDTPQALGDDENIWIMLYSDSEYAAYCGRYPVDATNGKIWYTTNGESWYSNTTYTPVIYTHFLTIDGREVVVDLANMKIRESNPANGQIGEAEGEAMGVSKAQIAQNSGKRDVIDNNIEDLYVKAGTYYLVIASTDAEFPVSIETAEVPAPEQAIVYAPMDGETNVESSVDDPYVAQWVIGEYTEEMQVLLGTQYPPQTALIDWTTELVAGVFLPELEPNQSYFMQVNERNAAGTTMGEIIAFTTPISAVEEVVVTNPELYPGDAAMLTWTAPERSFKGYNIYQDGVKINESLVTTTEYPVEDLPYNMDGYLFQVSAVYDAGESLLSAPDTAYMTGFGSVNGYVYDTDTLHPIANATMVVVGIDEYGAIQQYEFLTDETGFYEGEVLAGLYAVGILTEGYETAATVIYVAYDQLTGVADIITHEFYYPLGQITATEEESDVLVEWSWDPAEMIVDFETGDFSQAEFTLPAQYPWAITTTNPYEGTYCMKSTCEGVASGVSSIEATVDVPFEEAKMGFYVRVSSETNYDKFHFYIDGVEKGSALSGELPYAYKEFSVTGGTHTYKWEYAKDGSVNANDDCIYVDNITMFRKDEPVPPTPGATTYTFDNSTMEGWTSLDANNDGYGWVLGSEAGGIYLIAGASLAGSGHNESADMVVSGSYTNYTQTAITPDNYLVAPAQMSVQDGASISFWACGQDSGCPAEHFGVAVSTGAATASEFTMVQEWTLTAKNAPAAEEHGEMRGSRAQGTWYNYSVDLSSYAGQDIWIAIRHFNCNDEFLLDVDDITLYDGTDRGFNRGNREFVSYNLYRRNNIDSTSVENPTLLAEGIAGDVYEYLDTEWPALPYGEWQWGIQATYEGYAPEMDRDDILFTDDFEDGALTNWTTVDADGDGDTWQNATPASYGIGDAHSGTNCASSWSWNSVSMYPDNWMISPMVEGATSIQYYVATNTAYPDHYGIYASSTGTSTSDFTLVFEETAGSKGGNGVKSSMTQGSSREMSAWIEKNIELPAGTKYVAFRHWNSDDMNYLFIDDVTIEGAGRGDRAPLSYKLMLDGEYVGETYYPFAQLPVEGMTEGSQHVAAVAPLYASGMGEWSEYTFTYNPCDNFDGTTSFNTSVNNADVTLTWTLPDGPTPPTPGEGQWYYYDNGTNEDAIGTGGGNFYWGVMFPAGSYEGNAVTKVSTYDYMAMTGNVTIYNDGTTAPATAVGTADVTLTGSEEFVEVEFATPVTIDPSKNLWIIYYNGSGATYPAAVCANTGDPNGRWVSIDGIDWMDLVTAGLDNTFMVRAYVATANKGEVVEISAPQGNGSNGTLAKAGVAKANRGNRAAWDLVTSFTGTSAGQQAVATDGNYIYTASWQSAPTGGYTFYQYTMDGTFVEGFNIAGATGIRDLTTDGQYFYGSSGGAQIFCMDFTTRTLVSTINCSGLTSRHLTYDPVRDGFWSGNWTTLALYSRTGALIQNGPAPTSAYGSSYYVDADGVEHLYLFCQISPDGSGQTTNRVEVIDYNITTNTLVSDPVHVCNDMPGYDAADGIAGGCFIGTYNNKTCFFANVQQSPNVVAIYDLEAGPVPPTPPTEGILGVILYRNDEFVGIFDANTTTFVDEGLESGHYDYTIRVIYGGEYDVTYYAMSCGDEAEAVINIGVTENDEVINSIYPNPTSGDLYINATAMKHVTVFNAMGQMVLDQEVSGDSMVLNMGQLESGVYMVKVTTETGSNVKRINVVK